MKTSGMTRTLYNCPAVPLTPTGPEVRLVVATHAGTSSSPTVGTERDGMVYELFVSTFPSPAFTASDVLDLYGALEGRLRPRSQMKTLNKTRIAGTPIPPVAKSSPRSSLSGRGISGWSWANSSFRSNCTPPNLPPRATPKLPRPTRQHQRSHHCLRSCTAHRNGPAHPLRMAFPAPRLLHNLMGPCVVLPIIRSLRRPDAPNAMGPCGSCLPHASAIVAPAPCAPSVKRAGTRSSLGE
jgi:hypothetical protein